MPHTVKRRRDTILAAIAVAVILANGMIAPAEAAPRSEAVRVVVQVLAFVPRVLVTVQGCDRAKTCIRI